MNSQRLLCLILLLAATALLTGCLQLNISVGIDDRFTSYLSYEIEMDVGGVDSQYHDILARALNSLGWYYQEELGFTVGFDTDSDVYRLTMRRSAENESLPDAFESLKAMLTDEDITPFMRVDMSLESFPGVDSYVVDAMLDIGQIIERSGAEELPPDLQAELESALETSGGTVTLTMPVSEVIESSHDTEMYYIAAVMEVPLEFDGQTEFDFRGSLIYSENGVETGGFEEILARFEHTRILVLVICSTALALLLIILTVVLLRIRRHNKLY